MKQVNRIITTVSIIIFSLFLIPFSAFSHEKHEIKVAYFTRIIDADSSNSEAYFLRGVEYQSHGDFIEAQKDFFKVLFLKPSHRHVNLNLARLYHEHLKLDSALYFANTVIKDKPESRKALECRAQIYHSQEKYTLSTKDYKRVLVLSEEPGIELFLAVSKNYEALSNIDGARASLLDAMITLGPIIPLKNALLDLEAKNAQWSNAHALVDEVISKQQRKETWYVKKAEFYLEEGKIDEAAKQYHLAKIELEKLSLNKRNTDFVRDLERKIQINLELIN